MECYPYALQFPFSKTTLNFREINCAEQSLLCKINDTLPPTHEYRGDYLNVLIEILQKVIKDKESIYGLDLIEFLMFVIRLRTVSIGSFIEFSIGDEKKKNIKFDLYTLLKNVYNAGCIINDKENINTEDVEIKLKWPDLYGEYHFLETYHENDTVKFLSTMCQFVDYIKIKDQSFNFKFLKNTQRIELFELLPLSVKNLIQTDVIFLLQKLREQPLFELEEFENYKLEFYNFTIQDIIRFIFANNENSLIAENVFLLNKGFTIGDINLMPPITKQNYINYFIEQNNTNKSDEVT